MRLEEINPERLMKIAQSKHSALMVNALTTVAKAIKAERAACNEPALTHYSDMGRVERLEAVNAELVAHLKFAVALLALIPAFGISAQVEAMRATLAKAAA